MNTENTRIIEINGIKLEVDLSNAKVVDNFRIGDTVKVLVKKYSDTWESFPGIIVAFDAFEKLPTLVINYAESGYSDISLKTVYFNSENKDIEVIKCSKYELNFDYANATRLLTNDISDKKLELEKAQKKLDYFIRHFEESFRCFTEIIGKE